MLTLELTDREVSLIVEQLRFAEKNSRSGFGRWMAKHLDAFGATEWESRVQRAKVVYEEFVTLRRKLGDTEPVKVD